MFLLERGVMEKCRGKLFCNSSNRFPVGWAEVRAEGEAALQEKNGVNDKGECAHDVWVMFELSEA